MRKILIALVLLLSLTGCQKEEDSTALKSWVNGKVTQSETSLFMVGDALLHGAVYKQAKTESGDYDFSKMTSALKDIAGKYDLRFYNQETILGGVELGLSSYPCFNSPQEFGDIMMEYGFNLVSLANNHTLDKGSKGVAASMEYWAKQDAMTAGSYGSFEERNEVRIGESNGITYTLLAYTYGTNGILVPEGKEYLVNVYTKEMIEEDVKRVRPLVDVVIVSMHWGVEYTHNPTAEQKEMAQFLADLNVDLVIGQHPHVIQPVQWIDDTLIYYSLGNLISAQDGIMKTTGMMGALTINKIETENNSWIRIQNPKADLLFTVYDAGYRNLHLATVDMLDENYQKIYEEYIPVINWYDDSIQVGSIK